MQNKVFPNFDLKLESYVTRDDNEIFITYCKTELQIYVNKAGKTIKIELEFKNEVKYHESTDLITKTEKQNEVVNETVKSLIYGVETYKDELKDMSFQDLEAFAVCKIPNLKAEILNEIKDELSRIQH